MAKAPQPKLNAAELYRAAGLKRSAAERAKRRGEATHKGRSKKEAEPGK